MARVDIMYADVYFFLTRVPAKPYFFLDFRDIFLSKSVQIRKIWLMNSFFFENQEKSGNYGAKRTNYDIKKTKKL